MKNSKNTIHLIQEITRGIPHDPEIFYTESIAGTHFEKIVTANDVKFRTKKENETWSDYHTAFHEYTHSGELPYDTADWELHWFKKTANDEQIIHTKFSNILQSFDEIEVHPCRYIDKDSIEQCEADNADFWTVYYHLTDGGLDCIADFATKKLANTFKNFLESLIVKYQPQDEAHITWGTDDIEWAARREEIYQLETNGRKSLAQKLESNSRMPIPRKHLIYDRKKFKEILHMMVNNHDSNEGVTWATVESYLDDHCKLKP